MNAALVEAQGLVVRYRERDPAVLDGLDLRVAPGERLAIMGPSGCGKSSLLTHLAGLRQPQAGTVSLGGQALSSLSATQLDQMRAVTMGFVFQRAFLLPYLSVRENVELAFEALPPAERSGSATRVDATLEALGLRSIASRRAADLSVGEAQRVAVARAVVKSPPLLIADEPTGALDGDNVHLIADLICGAAERAVIVATHDERVAARCQRVLYLRDRVLSPTR